MKNFCKNNIRELVIIIYTLLISPFLYVVAGPDLVFLFVLVSIMMIGVFTFEKELN